MAEEHTSQVREDFRGGQGPLVPLQECTGQSGERIFQVGFRTGVRDRVHASYTYNGIFPECQILNLPDHEIQNEIQNNNIVVNENMETNIAGMYACGDCTGGIFQITKAVYEGMKAGLTAIQYLKRG